MPRYLRSGNNWLYEINWDICNCNEYIGLFFPCIKDDVGPKTSQLTESINITQNFDDENLIFVRIGT